MFPEPILSQLLTVPGVLAALTEGQRAIAHLVALLALLVVAGLVLLVRRARRPDETDERPRIPEEER